jgi:uncharacterized damage-inducible protein DinB
MNTMPLESLIEQMHWANARMIEALQSRAGSELPPNMLRLAGHILTAESLWINRMLGRDYVRNAFLEIAIPEMAAKNDANRNDFLGLVQGDTSRRMDYQLINGTPMNSSIDDILLHVSTHGFHHRGQMAALARQHDWTFPDTSFISYSRRGS